MLVTLIAVALLAPTAPAAAQVTRCPVGDQPAATLLFPYFEVDLDGERTTLIAISSHFFGEDQLVRVVLWTDWAVPTLAFDLFLRRTGVQTINLRDVFATARGPRSSLGSRSFPGCPAELTGEHAGWTPALLQAAHTGRQVADDGCYANPRADSTLATGYITVDVTQRCPSPATRRLALTPAAAGGYFGGSSPVAANQNGIIGDWFLVDPGQDFAGGNGAVHVVADPGLYAGDYTFYGTYVGFDGSDKRLPLATQWRARYLLGGGFDGGTDLIVWRDTRHVSPLPYHCTLGGPPWRPLRERRIDIWNEDAQRTTRFDTEYFDLATQRVPVSALSPLHPFGMLTVSFDHGDGTRAQGWMGWEARAQHRFNASLAAIPQACAIFP